MIHGVYLKSRPKGKWHLITVAVSPEAATHDIDEILKQAHREGNEQAEAVVQVFDSNFYIPELLNEVKPQKPMYN
jgi:hypothetical protein